LILRIRLSLKLSRRASLVPHSKQTRKIPKKIMYWDGKRKVNICVNYFNVATRRRKKKEKDRLWHTLRVRLKPILFVTTSPTGMTLLLRKQGDTALTNASSPSSIGLISAHTPDESRGYPREVKSNIALMERTPSHESFLPYSSCLFA
jgi:hypothetical protein